jgi:diguanylate cyclase (GGDEF)-like protein
MHFLEKLLRDQELWLMRRVRDYALEREYTRYTSTLEEAWRVSISGLTDSIICALAISDDPWELGPDDDYVNDPMAEFGKYEARMHRLRGITLEMFLGLMKYYRQSYLDLVNRSFPSQPEADSTKDSARYARFIERVFDRIEIAFCAEWTRSETVSNAIDELQVANRQMTNEKNRFLTIFESLPSAVFVLDDKGIIIHMNHAGARLIDPAATSGGHYYSHPDDQILFPWFEGELARFRMTGEGGVFEFQLMLAQGDHRQVKVRFREMQDISFKFPGTIVILEDITDLKRVEKDLIEAQSALRQQASHDPLTGLCNHGEILSILERQLSKSKRDGEAVSVIMADLDHFKRVNDTYGHLAGDEVLRQTAQRMRSVSRDYDYVGRYGGEEFLVVLRGCDKDSAVIFAERLRLCIGSKNMAVSEGTIPVTISLGVATGGGNEEHDADALVLAADKALYRAKRNGRNRVETAAVELSVATP